MTNLITKDLQGQEWYNGKVVRRQQIAHEFLRKQIIMKTTVARTQYCAAAYILFLVLFTGDFSAVISDEDRDTAKDKMYRM